MRASLAIAALLPALALQGCVVAAIPVLAAGSIGGSQLFKGDEVTAPKVAVAPPPPRQQTAGQAPLLAVEPAAALPEVAVREAPGAANTPPMLETSPIPAAEAVTAPSAEIAPGVAAPIGDYGPAEMALATSSPYWPFAQFARAAEAQRGSGKGVSAMVLPEGTNPLTPSFTSCGDRPLAAIVDLDPQGAAAGFSLTAAQLTPDPGLGAALSPLREGKIPVLWLSGAAAGESTAIAARLTALGLFGPTDELLLKGTTAGERKQTIRQRAAGKYCVVAIAGDEKSDFDELFDYLRDARTGQALDVLLGNGWFLVPPPLAADD